MAIFFFKSPYLHYSSELPAEKRIWSRIARKKGKNLEISCLEG
jgi:hypothetical protein